MLGAAAVAIQGQAGAASTYVTRVLGYSPDWYLLLGDTMATALIGASGTYQNNPQLGIDPIAQDDPGGRSVGLSGVTTETPHVTALAPLIGPDLTIDLIAQLDDLTKAKHVLITTGGGTDNGQFSIEVLTNGQIRAWSVAGGSARVFLGNIGDVPQGEAVKITYQRRSSATEWSQRVYVNGMAKAEDATPRTWAAVPAGIVYIGTWWDGANFVDPTDGLIAHVAGWNRLLAPVHIQDLVRTQSAAWAEDIDAGSVGLSLSKVISVKQGGWHGKEPLAATAGNGVLVTTTESGEEITILAGATTGTDDTFSYSFTDANGEASPTRTVTIDVVGAGGGDALVRPGYAAAIGQDANPSGAIWWNPTGGNDGNNGTTKALAKRTLSAAEAVLPGSNRTIIVTGGTHATGTITPGVNNYTLMAEQGTTVTLNCETEFSAFRTAPNSLWEQSGVYWRTKVAGQFSSGHMHGMWFEGTDTVWAIRNESSDNLNNSASANYAGPTVRVNSDGRIYLRFDKPSTAVTTNQFPSYQPGFNKSTGQWIYPSADPNNTVLYLRRRTLGAAAISTSGRSGLTFKDLNIIGCYIGYVSNGTESNITFNRCTLLGSQFGFTVNGTLTGLTITGCKWFHGYLDMYCWNDLKGLGGATNVGNDTWDDNGVFSMVGGGSDWLITDNLFVGWFDLAGGHGIPNFRLYNNWFENFRDDHIQNDIHGWNGYRDAYNVYDNTPMLASNETGPNGATSNDMQIHHNIQWQVLPRVWTKGGRPGPHLQTAWHFASGASTRRYIWKHYNNTIIISTGILDGAAISITHIGAEANNTTSVAHEVYNNIFMVWGDELWNNRDGANQDAVMWGLRLDGFSNELFDFNDYRRVLTYSPAVTALIYENYDRATRVGGPYHFTSVAALRNSAANIANHEANGTDLQSIGVSLANMKTAAANPFVQFDPHGAVYDMRIKAGDQAKSGAKNLSATGWEDTSGITAISERGAFGGGNTQVGPRSAVLNY